MTFNEYSWHAEPWRLAHAAIARGAHALLVAGARGLGKREFALRLAASFLCAARVSDEAPCGTCESCRWLDAGTHPDFALLEPPSEESTADGLETQPASARERPISVDQVRQLGALLSITSHRQAGKAVVVHPAEAMNIAAANALLKSLEEPPERTLFILVSSRRAQLPATVRSRCQTVPMKLNDWRAAETWLVAQGVENATQQLSFCGGAPLEARTLAAGTQWTRRREFLRSLIAADADGVALAEKFRDLPPGTMLSWLQKWTFDLLLMHFCGRVRYHLDLSAIAERLGARIEPRSVSRLFRRLLEHQKYVQHALNPRLFAEQILIDCRQVLAPSNLPGEEG